MIISHQIAGRNLKSSSSRERPSTGLSKDILPEANAIQTPCSSSADTAVYSSAHQGSHTRRVLSMSSRARNRSPSQASRGRGCRQVKKQRIRLQLACPCYLFNPKIFKACDRSRFTTISYVKQHLRRKHRCDECQMDTGKDHENPATTRNKTTCLQDHTTKPITAAMSDALSAKSSPKLGSDEQWFQVFDLIFPGAPRPTSPVLDSTLPSGIISWMPHFTVDTISEHFLPAMLARKDVFTRLLDSHARQKTSDLQEVALCVKDYLAKVCSQADDEVPQGSSSRRLLRSKTPIYHSRNASESSATLFSDSPIGIDPRGIVVPCASNNLAGTGEGTSQSMDAIRGNLLGLSAAHHHTLEGLLEFPGFDAPGPFVQVSLHCPPVLDPTEQPANDMDGIGAQSTSNKDLTGDFLEDPVLFMQGLEPNDLSGPWI